MTAILRPASSVPALFPAAGLIGKLAPHHGEPITGHFTVSARSESSVDLPADLSPALAKYSTVPRGIRWNCVLSVE